MKDSLWVFQGAGWKDMRAELAVRTGGKVGRVGGNEGRVRLRTRFLKGILALEVVCQSGGQVGRVR